MRRRDSMRRGAGLEQTLLSARGHAFGRARGRGLGASGMSNTPRVLVLSNLYPPFHLGGYELACADVVQALRSRGWDVLVLTSWRGAGRPQIERGVLRLLRCRLWCDPPFAGLGSELAWAYWNRRVLAAVAARSTARVIH